MLDEVPLNTWNLKSVNEEIHGKKIVVNLSIKDYEKLDSKSYQEEWFTITVEKKEAYKKERI